MSIWKPSWPRLAIRTSSWVLYVKLFCLGWPRVPWNWRCDRHGGLPIPASLSTILTSTFVCSKCHWIGTMTVTDAHLATSTSPPHQWFLLSQAMASSALTDASRYILCVWITFDLERTHHVIPGGRSLPVTTNGHTSLHQYRALTTIPVRLLHGQCIGNGDEKRRADKFCLCQKFIALLAEYMSGLVKPPWS